MGGGKASGKDCERRSDGAFPSARHSADQLTEVAPFHLHRSAGRRAWHCPRLGDKATEPRRLSGHGGTRAEVWVQGRYLVGFVWGRWTSPMLSEVLHPGPLPMSDRAPGPPPYLSCDSGPSTVLATPPLAPTLLCVSLCTLAPLTRTGRKLFALSSDPFCEPERCFSTPKRPFLFLSVAHVLLRAWRDDISVCNNGRVAGAVKKQVAAGNISGIIIIVIT